MLQRVGLDFKSREILVGGLTGRTQAVHRDEDDKLWSIVNPDPIPSPDGRWLAFLSDRDGWDHVYVVSSSGGAATQVTRGSFEAARIAWSPDSQRIAFDTNQGDHPGSRHLAVADLRNGPDPGRVSTFTSGRGTDMEPFWSPDGRRIAYQHTSPRESADIFVADAASINATRRVTASLPPEVDRSRLVEPRFVRYPSRDGQQVPASLFAAADLDRSRPHPAIVWIHGDGVNQNY
ncbi:MAG: PD40 domain-containing protein, partial [Acidobacteria bacterium]|nr:PD40 domain-containing protein [Acidobacteriota bacterium]